LEGENTTIYGGGGEENLERPSLLWKEGKKGGRSSQDSEQWKKKEGGLRAATVYLSAVPEEGEKRMSRAFLLSLAGE